MCYNKAKKVRDMKVMSFNVQNEIKKVKNEKINKIIELIKKEDPDIIGLQELTYKLKKKLEKELKDYHFFGRSRYCINTFFDEYNSILVKRTIEVFEVNTYSLGKRPDKVRSKNILSVFPRICTSILCLLKNKKIKIMNTHIDPFHKKSKKYQLSVISNILKNNNFPIIIMGDFNMHSDNEYLEKFVKSLNLVDVLRNEGKTFKESKSDKAIDHILIGKEFKYSNVRIIESDISDHYPVTCEIDIR